MQFLPSYKVCMVSLEYSSVPYALIEKIDTTPWFHLYVHLLSLMSNPSLVDL